MLGYDEGRDSLAWEEKGVELLILCQREEEVIRARKAGFRGVLAHTEYLGDRERFDGVILADASYRLFEPDRAVAGIIRSLRPDGRVLLELPLPGHLETTQRVLALSIARLGLEKKIEKIAYVEAESWRCRFRQSGLRLKEAQVVYRHHRVSEAELRDWAEKILSYRALLLEETERLRLFETFIEMLKEEAEREGVLTEEEVLLRIVGRRA